MTTASSINRTIDAVWRIESARLIAGLVRMVHDVGLAEELAQDALVAALKQWPESGVPRNPGAWLIGEVAFRGFIGWSTSLNATHQSLGAGSQKLF